MDIASVNSVLPGYLKDAVQESQGEQAEGKSFDNVLQSVVKMLEETNTLQNYAEEAEIQFALGYSSNTHDLRIAQEKANIALQYTVAVRDKVIEAYKEIMNMQI